MKGNISMKKIIVFALVLIITASCLCGCIARESTIVNHNLSEAADNFQVARKITVYNARTDLIIMEMEGYMSLSNNSTKELVVTCRTGADQYKKNYVYLNEYVIYVVEDITSTVTDPYHYKIHFYTALPDFDINH
jgi:hypothetical protein